MLEKNLMKLPGESQTPRFLQRINWVFNPVQLMEKSAQAYGDFFTLKLSSQEPIVFISNPQAIQQIFTSPLENFEGVSNKLLKPLEKLIYLPILGANLKYVPPKPSTMLRVFASIIF